MSRDVFFIVDGGQTAVSANEAALKDFLAAAICQYNITTSRFALISTGTSAVAAMYLQNIASLDNWTSVVDAMHLDYAGEFPLAEALAMVKLQLNVMAPYQRPIVYILASQNPQPVPVGVNYGIGNASAAAFPPNYTEFTEFNSIPRLWNNGYFRAGTYPETYYPSQVCLDGSSSASCPARGRYTYDEYLNLTYAHTQDLYNMGGTVSVVLLPSAQSSTCPSNTFWLGHQDTSVCNDDATDSSYPLGYTWCAKYPVNLISWEQHWQTFTILGVPIEEMEYSVQAGSWTAANTCRCAFLRGAISPWVSCAGTVTTNTLLTAIDQAACVLPTSAPTQPTFRPTHVPTPPTTPAPVTPTAAPFCSAIDNLPSCFDVVARDLLFVVDKADSNNQTFLRDQLETFAEQLTCTFDDAAGSFFGLISYGHDVRVEVRLGRYTHNEWKTEMENLRNSSTLDLNGGLSPLAEALELARREMNTFGDPSHYQLILVLTSSQPQPIDQFDGNTGFPSPVATDSSSIFPSVYYPYISCDPFCSTYSYNAYLGQILPAAAQAIQQNGIDLMVMTLPNANGHLPDSSIFQGLPLLDLITVNPGYPPSPCNVDQEETPQDDSCAPNCNWCFPYPDRLAGGLNECKCTYLDGALVTSPTSAHIFSDATWNVTNMVHLSYKTVCETRSPTPFPTQQPSLGTTQTPTMSPRLRPTRLPSQSPTQSPSASPVKSSPSASPSEAPSASPTQSSPTSSPINNPSQSPVSSAPTLRPTTSKPTGGRPTTSPTQRPRSPSKSPSKSHPTVSPLFVLPSVSPLWAVPTVAPSWSRPSASPSKSPTRPTTLAPHTTSAPAPTTTAAPTNPTTQSPTAPFTQLPTVAVTPKPTPRPTSRPTQSPKRSHPSRSPSHQHPSRSPSHSHPSRSPTREPTTALPSSSPTLSSPTASPLGGAPSASPRSVKPSKTPTLSKPSRSPLRSRPSVSPSLSPVWRPTASPASARPSASPISRRPSQSPLSTAPSRSPTPPTRRPTAAPVTKTPTRSPLASTPTSSPVSWTPTRSPTPRPSRAPSPPTTYAPSTSPTVYCNQQAWTDPCPNAANNGADIILALDFGLTQDAENASTLFTFAHQFHCRYLGAGDRMGLILYGSIVQLVIPLGHYTQLEWDNAIDYSISAKAWGNATSPSFRGQNPVLEVFDVAYRELFLNTSNRNSSTNSLFYVHLITSNLPLQVPIAENKTSFGKAITIPSPWGYPYPPRYLGSSTCLNPYGVPGYSYCDLSPPVAVSYQKYITKMTTVVNQLLHYGTVINVLIMPNSSGLCNEAAQSFWNGTALQTSNCNNAKVDVGVGLAPTTCPTCNFCALFNDQSSHDPGVVYPAQCHCATVSQQLTTLPVAQCTPWNLTAMWDNMATAACLTRSPSKSPTASPSRKPSKSPTVSHPSRAPTTNMPSASPSRSPSLQTPSKSPSARPSKAPSTSNPTKSPTTRRPSRSPSSSPTTKSPSKSPSFSPSNAPTSGKPSASPVSRSPSRSPATAVPSSSPSSSPSRSPTSGRPSASPTSKSPSSSPTTKSPTSSPTTGVPSQSPSKTPTSSKPSKSPTTSRPSKSPFTKRPSTSPSQSPVSRKPSVSPTHSPSGAPTSLAPTASPSAQQPTRSPSSSPQTRRPSRSPTSAPTSLAPTASPSAQQPTRSPSSSPQTRRPSRSPTSAPTTKKPTRSPSISPGTARPSRSPSKSPTSTRPTRSPSASPVSQRPSHSPLTTVPSASPSNAPSKSPSTAPSSSPSKSPSTAPSSSPSRSAPSFSPSRAPFHSSPSKTPSSSPITLRPSFSPSVAPTPGSHGLSNVGIGLLGGLGGLLVALSSLTTLFFVRRKKRLWFIMRMEENQGSQEFVVMYYGFVLPETVKASDLCKDYPKAVKLFITAAANDADEEKKRMALAFQQALGRAWEIGVPAAAAT